MSRRAAFLILLALWAAIYLPGLGSTEIKGEEGRRILPAVTMLETGNWLVPYVGGRPFLRKPPLVNWAIAGSFALLGRQDEWAARLPSALAVLGLCGLLVALSGPRERTALTPNIAFIAGIFFMSGFGLLAKARFAGAEIEGIYVPICGMGLACWLAWWEQGRSPWLVWTVPFVFFGLAALAKAPLHLVFFYAIAVAVLWRAGELRALWHPAHGVGLVLMGGIFAAWAVPYFSQEAASQAAKVWSDQFAGRVAENRFDLSSYLLNLPRGVCDQAPWILFGPVLWSRRRAWAGRTGAMVEGALLGSAAAFVVLLLIPGVLTRYVLPLSLPLALLLALAVGEDQLPPVSRALRVWWRTNAGLALTLVVLACAAPVAVVVAEKVRLREDGGRMGELPMLLGWPLVAASAALVVALAVFIGRRKLARPTRIAGTSAALLGAASFLYGAAAVPIINRADDVRPMAAAIDRAVGPGGRLWLLDIEYQPAVFYLRTPCSYATSLKELPADVAFVLVREGHQARLERGRPGLEVIGEFGADGKKRVVLLGLRTGVVAGEGAGGKRGSKGGEDP